MKITYELDTEKDEGAYYIREQLHKSEEMAIVLWELMTNSRKRLMYKVDELQENPRSKMICSEGVDLVFEHIQDLLEEYGIDVERLNC